MISYNVFLSEARKFAARANYETDEVHGSFTLGRFRIRKALLSTGAEVCVWCKFSRLTVVAPPGYDPDICLRSI